MLTSCGIFAVDLVEEVFIAETPRAGPTASRRSVGPKIQPSHYPEITLLNGRSGCFWEREVP